MMKQSLILAFFMAMIPFPFAKAQHLLEALDAPSIKEAKCVAQGYAWVSYNNSSDSRLSAALFDGVADGGRCICSASSDGRPVFATWNNTNQNWSCGNGTGPGSSDGIGTNPINGGRYCVEWRYEHSGPGGGDGENPENGIGSHPGDIRYVCVRWSDDNGTGSGIYRP